MVNIQKALNRYLNFFFVFSLRTFSDLSQNYWIEIFLTAKSFELRSGKTKTNKKHQAGERKSKRMRGKKINEEKLITVNCRNLFCCSSFHYFFLIFCVPPRAETRALKNWMNMEKCELVRYEWMREWIGTPRWWSGECCWQCKAALDFNCETKVDDCYLLQISFFIAMRKIANSF